MHAAYGTLRHARVRLYTKKRFDLVRYVSPASAATTLLHQVVLAAVPGSPNRVLSCWSPSARQEIGSSSERVRVPDDALSDQRNEAGGTN